MSDFNVGRSRAFILLCLAHCLHKVRSANVSGANLTLSPYVKECRFVHWRVQIDTGFGIVGDTIQLQSIIFLGWGPTLTAC